MKIGITGANGQLGKTFQQLAPHYPKWDFYFADRTKADLAQPQTVTQWLAEIRPDCLINCAAYTNVNQAETEVELAHRINVEGITQLAAYSHQAGIPLFHYSSDYVYHTESGIPLRENDPTNPSGVYARTKLEGEQSALAADPLMTVIRTSWVYSAHGHNFVRTMLRLGAQKSELKVVCDQIGTPTYTVDLATASLEILSQLEAGRVDRAAMAGVFNFSNEGVSSWYDFAVAIFELAGMDCRVIPVESHEFPSPVVRPHYSVLNKSHFKQTFQLEIPHWRQALRRCLLELGR